VATAAIPDAVESAAFLRLWDRRTLTPTLARHLLKLGFDAGDQARMRELAARNQAGTITPAELLELDDFLRASLTLTVLQARARRLLRPDDGGGRG
jgi:hypothetical protein